MIRTLAVKFKISRWVVHEKCLGRCEACVLRFKCYTDRGIHNDPLLLGDDSLLINDDEYNKYLESELFG